MTKEPVDSVPLVYRTDIILLIVILVFTTFNAPRAIARFAHRSQRFQGLALYSVALTRKPRITQFAYLQSDPCKPPLDLDGGSTEAMHTQSHPYDFSRSTHNEKAIPFRPMTIVAPESAQQTWHMPMLSSLVDPIANLLHSRVHKHYSLGQVLLMVGYGIIILYTGLYRSNPFLDVNDRSGWVSVSQLPLIYVLASKNNAIGILVGVGYEKLNYLHRFAGFLGVFAANVHALAYFYQWSIKGTILMHFKKPATRWALVALVSFDMLGLFSMRSMRSKSYNLFFATHVVASFVVLFSVCLHRTQCFPYIVVASVFYCLDHVARLLKTRVTTATLRPIPELGLTRVEMPAINAGWRAGQHVRLRVLSTAMGLWGTTEVHPFTIASVSKTEEGLVLLCKKAGRWTTKMYEMASTSVYGERGQEVGRSVRVLVEGPYGGIGHTVLQSYSAALFVVGGSGVTFALSTVQDLVRSGYSSAVTDMDVVWCIADPASLTPMLPLFTALTTSSAAARLRVSVYYTRSPSASLDGAYLPPGVTLAAGRPKLRQHLDELALATLSAGGQSGVFVGACGPASLAGSVGEVVRRFDPGRKRAVGGIEFHEEVFGW